MHTIVEVLDHQGGRAFTTDSRPFNVGEGLRIDLRLPNGEGLRILGIVREVLRDAADAAQRVDLDFRTHRETDRRQLAAYANRSHARDSAPIRARLTRKFELRRTEERLSISLAGALTVDEAQSLCELVEDALAPTAFEVRGELPLVVCIDATQFSACPEATLEWMRRWLTLLVSRGPMLGVLIGASSVGMMQLQRLVRAVGVAEHLMLCNSHEQAEATLAAMTHELFGDDQ